MGVFIYFCICLYFSRHMRLNFRGVKPLCISGFNNLHISLFTDGHVLLLHKSLI